MIFYCLYHEIYTKLWSIDLRLHYHELYYNMPSAFHIAVPCYTDFTLHHIISITSISQYNHNTILQHATRHHITFLYITLQYSWETSIFWLLLHITSRHATLHYYIMLYVLHYVTALCCMYCITLLHCTLHYVIHTWYSVTLRVLTFVVLINLLIAMLSDTYQRIQARSDLEWKYGRAKLVMNMDTAAITPPPLNTLTILVLSIKDCCHSKYTLDLYRTGAFHSCFLW